MTDRNDGRPRHSASHIHCAVPFFLCPKRNRRGGSVALRGRAKFFGGEWVVRSAGVHLGCVGEQKCLGGRVAVRACVGVAWGRAEVLGKGVRKCSGRAKAFGGEWVVRSAGNASRSLRACVGAAWASGSAREGRVAVRGRAKVFGGEWVVRAAGLTHIRRSSTRARVLLYIRPPCPRREIAAMGSKDAPCEHPSPANDFRTRPVRVCTSAPAFTLSPSAFTLLPHRLPRPPQSNRHPAAAVIHNGLSTEKLSTLLLAALCKTFSPSRLRTRIYNISFVRRPLPGVSAPLWGRGRAVVAPCPAPPSAGWGRAKAKADAPSCSAEPCRLYAESLCAKADAPSRSNPPLSAYRPAPAA